MKIKISHNRHDGDQRPVGSVQPLSGGGGTSHYAATKVTYDDSGRVTRIEQGYEELGSEWIYFGTELQRGKQYDDFGNFNYGAMSAAMGAPDQMILRGAGWAQMRSGNYDPSFGTWWGGPPYGDDPADQTQIQNGINYYRQGCHG